jgi:hypothetical protein
MTVLEIPEDYKAFHEAVTQACVDLMTGRCVNDDGSMWTADEVREFFDKQCSFEEEFAEGMKPAEVAEAQWEAIT